MSDLKNPLGLIGFGEAGQAFTKGWRSHLPELGLSAFDIKTNGPLAAEMNAIYGNHAVTGCADPSDLAGHDIFSLVTADQALDAAQAASPHLAGGQFFFDCNSCAPQTKNESAKHVEAAGGLYVDTAIMSPVHPLLHQSPLLISGPHAEAALPLLHALGMKATLVEGEVGTASSIKMVRSIMMKGLEAVTMECVLAGRAAGVDERVLASLDVTYPGFDWTRQATRMMERATTHGVRRAAEMREVAKTVELLGLPPAMSTATVSWMERAASSGIKDMGLGDDYTKLSDQLLKSTRK